jgi:hypothetical protein
MIDACKCGLARCAAAFPTTLLKLAGGLALACTGIAGTAAVQEPATAPASAAQWAAIDHAFSEIAPYRAMLAAEILDGQLVPVHALNADRTLPVGSSFKLYVLGELSRQVEAERFDWEQLVPITESQKSVPGGDLRYVPNGTTFTVRYLAERMIQKSDNTATDVLIDLVGRENVERAMGVMGHHNPGLNIPLLKTREFAFMKLVVPSERLDAYFAADVPARRSFLADVVAGLSYEDLIAAAERQTAPIDIMRTEWLASRNDLAKAISYLWVQSRKPGLRPVSEILSLESQLEFNAEVWPYVGFKGGSELGVLSGTWLMQRADGRLFVYSAGFADPKQPLDMEKVIAALEMGVDRLAVVK